MQWLFNYLRLKWILITLFIGVFSFSQSYASITLLKVPVGMKKQNADITIAWTGAADRVHIRASTVPGGSALQNIQTTLAHYDSLHLPSQVDAGTYSFRVNPDIPAQYRNTDLRYGINYCVLTDGISSSSEFIILIESSNAPVLVSPSNAASIKDLTPTFSWTGDAPFYAVLVSDEPFKISDSGTVTGVSAVWQIITPYTSARYGDPDPSGINTVVAPPLISGKTYNWLVLNNYGNNSASTSKVAPVPFSFVYAPAAPLASPTLIEPNNADTIPGLDQILFRWALVDGAVSYKLELLEENLVDGSQADIALWKAASTGGQIVLDNATGLLRRYNYKWRVYAIGSNGSASISEKRKFFYAIDVGNINLTLFNQAGQKIPYAAVKLNRLGGSSSAVFQSGSTDNNGTLTVNKAPLGSYEIKVENLDGYATKIDTIIHNSISGSSKTITLSPVLGKIVGAIKNSSNGIGILNAKVSATNSNGSVSTATTNSQGNYTLGIAYGNWQIKAEATGYATSASASVSLNQNTPLQNQDLSLVANLYTLSGTISNSFSHQGLFGATVFLTQDGVTRTQNTDGNGNFSFSVPLGSMSIRVSSPGFAAPEQQSINIEGDKTICIALDPNASILSGRCKDNSGTALPGIIVQATPKSGPVRSVLSDKQGYYELSLPAGDWILTSSATGFSSTSNHKFYLDISKTVQGVDFVLQANQSSLAGRTTFNGAGLSGVLISAGNSTALTDNSGYYLLSVNEGNQAVVASKEGYLISKTYTISVNAGESLTGLDFIASGNAAVVKGKVVAGGSAVVNAEVTATNQNNRQTFTQLTNQDGNYSLSLPGGNYQITANKEAFIVDQIVNTSVPDGGVILDMNIRLNPDQAGIIGTVSTGNISLSGCEVAYKNTLNSSNNGKTVTDAQGRYAISLQSGNSYELMTQCSGYQSSNQTSAALTRGQNLSLDFSLSKAGAIYRGKVVNTAGKILVGAKVLAEKNGVTAVATTDFTGSYTLSLGAGLYSITLSMVGYGNKIRTVSLALGENGVGNADTLITSTGKIAGHITSDGNAVTGAFVSLINNSGAGGGFVFSTDADGRFSADNVPTGNYSVNVTADGFTDSKNPSVTVNLGQLTSTEIVLIANRASLSGLVQSGGNPIAGVSITANAFNISKSTLSGADGKYKIDNLPSGNFSLSANLVQYSSDRTWDNQVLASSGSLNNLNFILSKNVGSLFGTISGAAIASGIRITLVGAKGTRAYASCDGSGKYNFPSLPADDFTLTVQASGYKLSGTTQSPIISISAAQNYNPQLVSALFQFSGNLFNQAEQGVGGLPLELSSASDKYKTTTGSDGSFVFNNIPAGNDYKIAAKPPTADFDAVDSTFSVGLEIDKISNAHFHTISRQSNLSGIIYLDDSPIEGAVIRTAGNGNNQAVLSQPNGVFKISGIAGSSKPLSGNITRAGAKSIDTSFTLGLVENKSGIEFRLKTLNLQLTSLLKDSEGKSLKNAKVVVARGSKLDTITANNSGKITISKLPANQALTLVTLLDKSIYDNQELPVFLGEIDSAFNIQLKIHNSSISLTLKDQNGALVDGANVSLNGNTLGQTSAGKWTVNHLARGEYHIICGKASYKSSVEQILPLSGDTNVTTQITFTKVDGGVYGSVKDSTVDKGATSLVSRLMAGATIKFNSGIDSLVDTVNAFGQYFATNLVAGRNYQITLALPGYYRLTDSITAASQAQNKDLVLLPLPSTLLGKSLSGNSPVTVKLIHAASGQIKLTTTNFGGYYAFSGLQNGNDYFVQGFTQNLSTPVASITASGAFAKRFDLELDSLVLLKGKVNATLNGSQDSPLSGAKVSAKNKSSGITTSAFTDSLGQFSLYGLSSGKYDISAERLGYLNPKSQSVTLSKGTTPSGINFIMDPTDAGITGIVKDEQNLPTSAVVKLVSKKDTLLYSTNGNGQFVFIGLASGEYQFIVQKNGYSLINSTPLTYSGKGLLSRDLILRKSKNYIAGTLRDAVTNTIVAGAKVKTLTSTPLSVSCDSNGYYELALTESISSPLLLEASQEGYLTRSKIPVFMDSNNFATQDISLNADYKFTGEIDVSVKEGKDTLAGLFVTVQSFHPDDSLHFGVSGKAPNSFRDLRWPMTYTLKLKRDGFKDMTKTVSLTAKNPKQKIILSYPTSQIKVFVTSDGKRGKGIDLSLNGEKLTESVDTSGLYLSAAKLKPANYEVTIKDPEANLIPVAPYFIGLGEDSVRTDTLREAFFQKPILDSIIGSDFSVSVARIDTLAPLAAVVCSLYYRYEGSLVWNALKLDSAAKGFSGKFPAQSRAGNYEYYSVLSAEKGAKIEVTTPAGTSHGTGSIRYSNIQSPAKFILRDPYLLFSIALLPQRLEADTSLYSLGARDLFQVQLRGEKGRNLNAYFDPLTLKKDSNVSVTWKFTNEAFAKKLGLSLTPDSTTPRLCHFKGGIVPSDSLIEITCTVKLATVTLSKNLFVRIQNLWPATVGIKYVKENRELEAEGVTLSLSNLNANGYAFSAFAKTSEGRIFNISPRWSFGGDSVIGYLSQQGLFIPDSTVARGAILSIYDTLAVGISNEGATLKKAFVFNSNLATFTQVAPAAKGNTVVSNGEGTILNFNLAGLSKAFTVSVKKPPVSGLLRSSPEQEVVGEILDIELSERQPFKADSGAVLTMPVSEGIARARTVFLGHWNSSRLAWEKVDSTKKDTAVKGKVYSFSKYAVLMGSLPLGAYDFTFAPNPFSAEDPWGLQLSYKVSSDVSSQVGVRVEVYNIMGDKVYETDEVQLSKGDVVKPGLKKAGLQSSDRRTALGPYVWDGHDSSGRPCRNGRYLIKLIVKDGQGSKSYLKKVVMLK